jgi:hypothetical protein
MGIARDGRMEIQISVATDVRRLISKLQENESEPPYVGCYYLMDCYTADRFVFETSRTADTTIFLSTALHMS